MIRNVLPAAPALALGVLVATVPAAAGAQEAGVLDAGVAARRATFDDALALDGTWGIAGHAGYFLRRRFSVEGQVGAVDTRGARAPRADVAHRTWYARALVHLPFLARATLHAGGGYAFASYGDMLESGHGASGVLGVRRSLTERLGLRIDATADYYPGPSNDAQLAARGWNHSVQVGLSYFVRGRVGPQTPPPPPDADGDGVIDADDRCAGTPIGTVVNAEGCPAPPPPPPAANVAWSLRLIE